MGLDMYAYTTSAPQDGSVDFPVPPEAAELHRWRKHPDLHGWMEQLYREKGGGDDLFNAVTLALTAADLDRLEADIKACRLPPTIGFFFGVSGAGTMEGDLAFVHKARTALAADLTVFYTPSW
jgi:hypothetical protein